MNQVAPLQRIRVWDLPLRLFHWALLVCVTGAVLAIEVFDNIDWHQRFGFGVLALVIFRILWGFVGGRHARFASFVRGPGTMLAYLRSSVAHGVGHNPLGAVSVLALLLVLALQAGSGLFMTDEIFFEAPLFKYVSGATASLLGSLHEINVNVLYALVALHVAAILFYRFVKRNNLVTPMITGSKAVTAEEATHADTGGAAWLGLVVFALAAAVVWYIATRL
ncbi:MAG: cytochrome b/b6 domain-containing protein [Candidatus Dactylopiibacterium sp.]|nr:cytochrome b/b6 domain-containing protein [Candidatus Dactylopiibacterium sp.]